MVTTRVKHPEGVKFIRPEVWEKLPEYDLIHDCLAGERVVKERAEKYLPDPSPIGTVSVEKTTRYRTYRQRAVFYNVSRYTMNGYLGQIFAKPPVIVAPDALANVIRSPSGDDCSLEQQSKQTTEFVIAYSRAGLLVDFPNTGGSASADDVASGIVRPTITPYRAAQIINWRIRDVGAEEVLELVVLEEIQQVPLSDGFATKEQVWYRVLRNVGGNVTSEIHKPSAENSQYVVEGPFPMLGGNGESLKRIPFRFIGLKGNSTEPEPPAFYDLCSLNLAHYRNSADYEESCFVVGQPTLSASGLDDDWLNNTLKGKLQFGARGGIPLPKDAKLEIHQAQPNTIVKEAMDAKEAQMRAIGAKLIDFDSKQKTATESKLDATSEGGILTSASKNVSEAYLWALRMCCEYLAIPVTTPEDVQEGSQATLDFKLNSEFDISRMSAEERKDVVAAWQAGVVVWEDVYRVYGKAGIATVDPEKAKKELEAQAEKKAADELKQQTELAKATGKANPKPGE